MNVNTATKEDIAQHINQRELKIQHLVRENRNLKSKLKIGMLSALNNIIRGSAEYDDESDLRDKMNLIECILEDVFDSLKEQDSE